VPGSSRASGNVLNLGQRRVVVGGSQHPVPGEPAISSRSPAAPGEPRIYQLWYRDAAPYCTRATHNLSNGLEIVWVP
jgi:hypothetical protein